MLGGCGIQQSGYNAETSRRCLHSLAPPGRCSCEKSFMAFKVKKYKYIYIQWWPKVLEHPTDLKILTCFASKTLFHFIMFMKHADGCSEQNKYQIK